jgi:hypothetical protein
MQANPTTVRVTKLDAARRQLETAIMLYFQYGDPVSVHTLCLAAYDVIQILNKQRNKPLTPNDMMLKDLHLFLDSKGHKKILHESLTAAQNFFKHGNTDSNSTHTLDTRLTEVLLFDAVQKYGRLVGRLPKMMALYLMWFVNLFVDRYPKILDDPGIADSLRKSIERHRKDLPKDRSEFYAEFLPIAKALSL